MDEQTKKTQYRNLLLIVMAIFVCTALTITGLFTTEAFNSSAECPGPLSADLTGTALSGKTPSGSALYKDKGNNQLVVKVRSVKLAQGTTLSVFIGDVSVGTIRLPRNGNGQLKLDAPAAAIEEGTAITVRNGATVILSGTFGCVGGSSNTNAVPNSNSNIANNSNMTNSNGMNSNMMNSNMMNSNMMNSNMMNSNMMNSNMMNSNMTNSNMTNSNMTNSNMTNSNSNANSNMNANAAASPTP